MARQLADAGIQIDDAEMSPTSPAADSDVDMPSLPSGAVVITARDLLILFLKISSEVNVFAYENLQTEWGGR